jgi:hypothetical protein
VGNAGRYIKIYTVSGEFPMDCTEIRHQIAQFLGKAGTGQDSYLQTARERAFV